MTTLRDLVLKKPQGSGDFMEALLDITTSDLELVGVAWCGRVNGCGCINLGTPPIAPYCEEILY